MRMPYLIFTLIILTGCHTHYAKNKVAFNCEIVQLKDIRYSHIDMDSFTLDPVNTSYQASTCISNHYIYLIDKKFCYIYKFSLDGRFISRNVGQGKGKNELPIKTILFFSSMQDGGFMLIGPTWDCYLYDSNFTQINDYAINWHAMATKEAMLKNPDPSETKMYSIMSNDSKIRSIDGEVFLPIISQHPTFNPTNPVYFKEARTLAKMMIDNGYISEILGKFSPAYAKNVHASTFPYQYIAITADKGFQISHAADSLIYESDRDFHIKLGFGFRGRNMDTQYQSVSNIDSFKNNLLHQLKNKGYYTSLECISDRNLSFRSYHKDAGQPTDGLQIYKGDTLVADLDVPVGFKVDGYNAPYFYSSAFIDEDNEKIKIYKFKLNL